MASRNIKINTNPVSNGYAGTDERIIEFSSPNGGGLISFRLSSAGRLSVDVYRTDETVDVRAPKPAPEPDEDSPEDDDGWVILDNGRYYIRWDDQEQAQTYPTREIAIYELAALAAKVGVFRRAWLTGEHGPAVMEITDDVQKYYPHEHGSTLQELPARYAPGTPVTYQGDDWVIRRDYGPLGVVLSASEVPDKLVHYIEITPAQA